MKKFLAILMALTLMLTLFAGCAKNADSKSDSTTAKPTEAPTEAPLSEDEKAILSDLKAEFHVENYDEVLAAGLKADKNLVATGIDIDEYAKALASKYNWEIGDPKIDGEKAVVKVTMTYPSIDAMDKLFDEKLEEYKITHDISKLSNADAQKLIGEITMEVVTAKDLQTETDDFDIEYIKEEGIWKMADSEAVVQAMQAAQGLDEAA